MRLSQDEQFASERVRLAQLTIKPGCPENIVGHCPTRLCSLVIQTHSAGIIFSHSFSTCPKAYVPWGVLIDPLYDGDTHYIGMDSPYTPKKTHVLTMAHIVIWGIWTIQAGGCYVNSIHWGLEITTDRWSRCWFNGDVFWTSLGIMNSVWLLCYGA